MQPCHSRLRWFSGLVSYLVVSAALGASPVRLVILHTNDLHDHVAAGDNGVGGLPYVSGYVRQVRAQEPAVLLLDAGDVTKKGDLVAFKTQSAMTYEAMRRIGYDGVAIGNHDFDREGEKGVRRFEQILGQTLLCLNIVQPDGRPKFTGSRIVEVAGIKVGLIGMITPRGPGQGGLDFAASGRALAREAARLREQVPLVIAICHENVAQSAAWARAAPAVQVFVTGHYHEVRETPFVVPETGALIVQAGSFAGWVGRLEIELDPATQKIIRHDGRLVAMRHDTIPADPAMLAWVREREQALAPQAREFVLTNPAELDRFAVARLAAEGLRRGAGTDIGFCHPYQVVLNGLPAGPVDVNTVFQTGGHFGSENVRVELTGAQVEAYVNALVTTKREPPEWTGFRITRHQASAGGETWRSDLEPARRYRVVMPRFEWETRYLPLADKSGPRVSAKPLALNFTDATVAYFRQVLAEGDTLQNRATELARLRED